MRSEKLSHQARIRTQVNRTQSPCPVPHPSSGAKPRICPPWGGVLGASFPGTQCCHLYNVGEGCPKNIYGVTFMPSSAAHRWRDCGGVCSSEEWDPAFGSRGSGSGETRGSEPQPRTSDTREGGSTSGLRLTTSCPRPQPALGPPALPAPGSSEEEGGRAACCAPNV